MEIVIHESTPELDKQDNEDPNSEDVGEPKVGMSFDTEAETRTYYASYARKKGFVVITRSSGKRDDGQRGHVTFCCHRGGKARTKALNLVKAHPTAKAECKAARNVPLHNNGKWILNTIVLEHNHEICPEKARYLKANRVIANHTKRTLELNCLAGITLTKTISSCVIEAKGHENLTWTKKDTRNYMDQVRRSQLKEGDAEAMHKYFMRMYEGNNNFFYAMDLVKENRLCNIFWADARSREACKEFGEVVTFDTTCLVNRHDMPFAPFVGVNHHGQSILLGCGLILREDTPSFVWFV
ncbi:protein FAR1-RELATED SEQUENCE 5-like [Rhododendron vialii]|uniref:protein FAR1-RELATED SEQUENCE 5-like n=1 Tax=Rhododendron vialii TaxID=182163 RepID=UPI00265EF044|nr:protein FAR1-RELATED SEQUENCE 5-like [Rhododendron vialii]